MANIGDRCGQRKLQILPRSSTAKSGGTKKEGRSSEHRSDTQVEATNNSPSSRAGTTAFAQLAKTFAATFQDFLHSCCQL